MGLMSRSQDFKVEDSSPCNTCKRRLDLRKCEAFDDIPMIFILGENDHQKPYPGDRGLQYLKEK